MSSLLVMGFMNTAFSPGEFAEVRLLVVFRVRGEFDPVREQADLAAVEIELPVERVVSFQAIQLLIRVLDPAFVFEFSVRVAYRFRIKA